ncbi:hypothetical protein WKT22_02720 [Candidatus Lokiarchaeum ossiferum]
MDDSGEKTMSLARKALKKSFQDITADLFPILKAIGNFKRFSILVTLLDGPISFQTLLLQSKLQKTALANHLVQLTSVKLIQKPTYGIYDLTLDGLEYLSALHETWMQSMNVHQKQLQRIQSRPMSSMFIKKLLHQE